MKRYLVRFGDFPVRALFLALAVSLVFGVVQVGEPIENTIKIVRNKLRDHPVSGQVVVVAIDDRSIAELGEAPWNGTLLADLVNRTRAAGARTIHLDHDLPRAPGPDADRLDAALAAAPGQITLPVRFSVDRTTNERRPILPPDRFVARGQLVNTTILVWWDDVVWQQLYAADVGGQVLPSLSSSLAGAGATSEGSFPIDLAQDVRTIPIISASDLLGRRVPDSQLAGRAVIIARTDIAVDHFRAPGVGLVPGVLFHVLGAETLLAGHPVDIGWGLPLLVTLLLAIALLHFRSRTVTIILLTGTVFALLLGPAALEAAQIHIEVMPALAAILTAAIARAVISVRRSFQTRGTTNIVTGMPNLHALRQVTSPPGGIVAAARIKNYAQITATLPPQHEKDLVDQIVARLRFGTGCSGIYQADEGRFVWFLDGGQTETVIEQIEGLNALFRSPIVVSARIIDLTVTFGLDPDESRPLMQRASSALVAAEEAARDGKRWATFNPASLEDAEWSMSLLARLDQGIDNGELWIAYQPKIDCTSGAIIGAEALVRWMHPEKGPVYPDQFIGAAEQGGRIERLTYFVLDRAIADAARINSSGHRRFGVAVNLSAVLLTSETLVPTVCTLLRKHDLEPGLLTLEVTETSTIGSDSEAIANLERLSAAGVLLSIDDYGTGFSTLEYLRRVPASEIKIDRSFVTMLHKSQSDRIMVNSTIQLAHSLGRKVVAEGVESQDILDELKRMRCDVIQGYHTGRPVPLAELLQRLERPGLRAA